MNTRLELYVNRLAKEWRKHGHIIIGVDFDNTISPYPTLLNTEDMERAIKILLKCQEVGCYIVIHTATTKERYPYILEYCAKIGLKVETINETPAFLNIIFGKAGSKPYCNIFIDDRACLPYSLDILEEAMMLQPNYVDNEEIPFIFNGREMTIIGKKVSYEFICGLYGCKPESRPTITVLTDEDSFSLAPQQSFTITPDTMISCIHTNNA